MAKNSAFEIDLEIATERGSFRVKGDQTRLVLYFPSVGSAVRVVRLIASKKWHESQVFGRYLGATVFETNVSGWQIACSGHGIKSNLTSRALGFQVTRLSLVNLIRAALWKFKQQVAP